MWCNQIFSLIDENDIIQNIIVADNYEVANTIARNIYGNGAYATDTTQYPVSVGCYHIDGFYYETDGVTELPRTNTAGEDALLAVKKAKTLEQRQIETELEIDYRLSMIELGLA